MSTKKNVPPLPHVQTVTILPTSNNLHRIKVNLTSGEEYILPLGGCSDSVAVEVQRMLTDKDLSDETLDFPDFMGGVTVGYEVVTPYKAITWLQRNVQNRGLRFSRVNKYALPMSKDQWLPTGESIQFDWDENLTDGQTRLYAVIKSGHPAIFLVIRGLPPKTQSVINQPLPRGAGDWLDHDNRFTGLPRGRDVAAICREIVVAGTGYNHLFGFEVAESVALMYKPEFRRIAPLLLKDREEFRVLARAGVRAAAVIALRKYPKKVLAFLRMLVSGSGSKGTAHYALFKYLTGANKRMGVRIDTPRDVFLKTLWAIAAQLDDKRIDVIPAATESSLLRFCEKNDRRSLLPPGLNWEHFVKIGGIRRNEEAAIKVRPDPWDTIDRFLKTKVAFTAAELAEALGVDHVSKVGGFIATLSQHGRIQRDPDNKGTWRVCSPASSDPTTI